MTGRGVDGFASPTVLRPFSSLHHLLLLPGQLALYLLVSPFIFTSNPLLLLYVYN
jgi:hypothetical protein